MFISRPFSFSQGISKRHGCCDFSAVILAGHVEGFCPATTLANHNKYFLIILFGSACHNNMVSFSKRFELQTSWQITKWHVHFISTIVEVYNADVLGFVTRKDACMAHTRTQFTNWHVHFISTNVKVYCRCSALCDT